MTATSTWCQNTATPAGSPDGPAGISSCPLPPPATWNLPSVPGFLYTGHFVSMASVTRLHVSQAHRGTPAPGSTHSSWLVFLRLVGISLYRHRTLPTVSPLVADEHVGCPHLLAVSESAARDLPEFKSHRSHGHKVGTWQWGQWSHSDTTLGVRVYLTLLHLQPLSPAPC